MLEWEPVPAQNRSQLSTAVFQSRCSPPSSAAWAVGEQSSISRTNFGLTGRWTGKISLELLLFNIQHGYQLAVFSECIFFPVHQQCTENVVCLILNAMFLYTASLWGLQSPHQSWGQQSLPCATCMNKLL